MEIEFEEREPFSKIYYRQIAPAKSLQLVHSREIQDDNRADRRSVDNSGSNQSNKVTENLLNNVKLPAINLPRFGGSRFTTELCELLNLPKRETQVNLVGINKKSSTINYRTTFLLKSSDNKYELNLECLVIDHITENIPSVPFETGALEIPKCVKLADATFNKTGKVHILLGANMFWELLLPEKQSARKNGYCKILFWTGY